VRADKFDRSSAITCPYLKSIECRICGESGHTSSYCKASNSSSTAAAAAPPVASLARVRLPPISSSSSSSYSQPSSKQIPRIVFPALEKEKKEQFAAAFPELSSRRRQSTQSTQSLPPLSFISRFRNDEPLLRRGPPEASPVHSPAAPSNKIVYNKRGNAFADLASSDDEEVGSPVHSPDAVGRYRATKKKPASWASLDTAPVVVAATAAPVSKFPPRVAPRVVAAALLAPLPPLAFKPRKATDKEDKKKLWGDTDSEDDEEFLKRGGLESN
jgi:hypothetical protein